VNTSDKPIELSVVVLCYHSENIIEKFVDQLLNEIRELKVSSELVLVANYDRNSDDKTQHKVRELEAKHPTVKVLAKEKEGGMGWDMRSGLSIAVGKYIAVIDGDGQMPASDIPIVYRLLKMGNYDLVKTYRARRYDGTLRKTFSVVYNILFRLLYSPDFPVRDVNSKPKIFTAEAYRRMKLVSNDWFTDAEIMIQALRNKMRICEVSTVFYKNERRPSFVNLRTAWEFLLNLIKYRFR
jgi:glycosyltransferase involved in cell wall biosynthesis